MTLRSQAIFAAMVLAAATASSLGGEITVASANNGILANFGSAAGNLTGILESTWNARQGLLWGPDGFLYAASDTAIIKYVPATRNWLTLIDSSGSGNPLNGVGGFDFGPDGALWVSSRNTPNLIRYDAASGQPLQVVSTTWEGNRKLLWGPDGYLYAAATDFIGKFNFQNGVSYTLIDSSGATNPLKGVGGMDFGPDGMLWVASANNSNLIRYNPANGGGTVIASTWEANRGLVWGADGYLYGASAAAIAKFDPASGNTYTLIDNNSGPIHGIGGLDYLGSPAVSAPSMLRCGVQVISVENPQDPTGLTTDPARALGRQDARSYYLGLNGSIVLQLGTPLRDVPGPDLGVWEESGVLPDESADVFLSRDLASWTYLGRILYHTPDSQLFDIGGLGLDGATYVRITDVSAADYGSPGFDLDAVTVIPEPSSCALLALATCWLLKGRKLHP